MFWLWIAVIYLLSCVMLYFNIFDNGYAVGLLSLVGAKFLLSDLPDLIRMKLAQRRARRELVRTSATEPWLDGSPFDSHEPAEQDFLRDLPVSGGSGGLRRLPGKDGI